MSFISIGGAGTPLTGDRQAYGQPFQLRALHRPGLAIAGFWLASSGAGQTSWAGSKEPVRQALARVPLPAELEGAVAKRRDEYRAGRLCAVYALGLLGIDSGVPGRGADRLPRWPPGVLGSISHCSDLALSAVASSDLYAGVGIDVEQCLDADEADSVAEVVASGAELLHLPGWLSRPMAVTLLFSAKEAIYKAIFPDLKRYVDFAEVCLHRALPGLLVFRPSCAWQSAGPPHGRAPWHEHIEWPVAFHIEAGKVVTLCVLSGES
ncbi:MULTISPECIES: 4'-phosphopantetheinyl transferase [unclassified Halomonas]|uniref:4'-phosphopantetheinyl transferase family protein n=1 Tax=unclassified Halomonas TaxID=2609666 RepID=UPI001C937AA4|nr:MULTISPECIES: 4'-phosphopantetheinyl transferase superfamily protein [unclassified Halomonas]MBY5926983.1 4'-phosphopantetheinyl transferase superfamily protein [Halomonas sp. DP4Y7-2]MBY6234025.1 4'-phosphopantetheinyl transferase superfamily protein [Halomonas sp. DP4Y7-1]